MKRILFAGSFRGSSGYSNAARSYLKCLDSYLQANPKAFELRLFTWVYEQSKLTEEEIKIINKYELKDDKELKEFCKQDYEVAWFFTPSILIDKLKFKTILENSKKNTSMVVWETDKVPKPWLENYNKYFSQIIVPCDWNKETFESQTGLPTYKIPYLVEKCSQKNMKHEKDKFKIFSMSQWIPRKGFDLLIKAYCSEFYNHEDVLLTIKTYGFGTVTGDFEADKKNIIEQVRAYKKSAIHYFDEQKCKINLITGLLSKSQLDDICDSSDVFCLPTRGEGFGLTIAEALNRQLPVIVPDKGGHLDFIHEDNFFVNSKFTTNFSSVTGDYSSVEMKMIETDIDHLRVQLRNTYNIWKQEPEQIHKIGVQSQLYLQEYCNPEKITNDLVSVLLS